MVYKTHLYVYLYSDIAYAHTHTTYSFRSLEENLSPHHNNTKMSKIINFSREHCTYIYT